MISTTARQTTLVLGGNLVSAALRFLIVAVVFARVFSKAEFAAFGVLVGLMDIVAIWGDGGLHPTQVHFTAAQRNGQPGPVVARCLVIKAVLCLAVWAMAWCVRDWFMAHEGLGLEHAWAYWLAVGAGVCMAFSTSALGVSQGLQRFRVFSIQSVLINGLRFVAVAAVILLGWRAFAPLTGAYFGATAVGLAASAGLALCLLRSRREQPPLQVGYAALLRFAIPLGLMNGIIILLLRVDQFMLKSLSTDSETADYILAYQVAFCFPLLARSLMTVLLPKVSALRTSDALLTYRSRVLRMFPAAMGVALLAAAILPWLLRPLWGTQYASADDVLRLLVLGFGIELIFNPLGLIFYAVERPRNMLLIHLTQLLVVVPLNWFILIPLYGGRGAALSLLAVRGLSVIAIMFWTRSILIAKANQGAPKGAAP